MSTLNMEVEYFIFGSYLTKKNFHDIDLLVVVPGENDIEAVQRNLKELKNKNQNNIVHFLLYTRSEYLNEENKFSHNKVSHKISYSEVEKLMSLGLK